MLTITSQISRRLISPDLVFLKLRFENIYCVNGRGRSGEQTAGGHPKASPRPRQPHFAGPALRELESACRLSIFWDPVTVPTVCFSGVLRTSSQGGQQQFATQTLRVHLLGIEKITRLPLHLYVMSCIPSLPNSFSTGVTWFDIFRFHWAMFSQCWSLLIFAVGVEPGENRGHLGREPGENRGLLVFIYKEYRGEKRGFWDKSRERTGGREFSLKQETQLGTCKSTNRTAREN